eukprot:COSAG02_NODE_2372_length_9029_cov_5.008735_3_plen_191_part_00
MRPGPRNGETKARRLAVAIWSRPKELIKSVFTSVFFLPDVATWALPSVVQTSTRKKAEGASPTPWTVGPSGSAPLRACTIYRIHVSCMQRCSRRCSPDRARHAHRAAQRARGLPDESARAGGGYVAHPLQSDRSRWAEPAAPRRRAPRRSAHCAHRLTHHCERCPLTHHAAQPFAYCHCTAHFPILSQPE